MYTRGMTHVRVLADVLSLLCPRHAPSRTSLGRLAVLVHRLVLERGGGG